MARYLLRRLLQMILVLWVVSVLVFAIMSFTGDPVYMLVPLDSRPEAVEQARRALGLDKPIITQYLIFLKNVLRGDFGVSFVFRQPAMRLILERLPATLELVLLASLIAVGVAIPLGVFSGAFPQRLASRAVMAGSLLGISLPSFWVGMMLIFIFAVSLRVLPSSGRGTALTFGRVRLSFLTLDGLRHLILPAVTLSLQTLAMLIRLTRAGILEVMRQDYIKFARAKGVGRASVLFKHALKNALITVVTIFGLQVGDLIAFTTITETVYAWPGMGKLLVDSINRIDRPVIVAYLMFVAFLFVLINFVVDLLYTVIDPRIKLK
jgi:peptide/nickel transport system permease protein